MDETSREGFVPRHLRGVDMDEYLHQRTKCQWHTIAGDNLRDPSRCNNDRWTISGLRLCHEHTMRIGTLNPQLYTLNNARRTLQWEEDDTCQRLRQEIERLRKLTTWQAKRLRGEPDPKQGDDKPKQGTVYALLSGYNVKVGYTSRPLAERLREYPPSTTVLTYFPGQRGDETRIKRKFAHLRTHGNEWLPYAPQVIEWVEQMNAQHGAPDPALTCGPTKREVPRPHSTKPQIRPRGWIGGSGAMPTGKSA